MITITGVWGQLIMDLTVITKHAWDKQVNSIILLATIDDHEEYQEAILLLPQQMVGHKED